MRDILDRDEIDHHIREWYRLSKGDAIEASDPFFRFVAAWVAFNAFYSSRMYDEVGDWNQVRAYAGEPEVVDWVHYVVPLSDLLSNSGSTLDLTQVNTPLVLFPAWGSQEGAVIQIDNVRWTR